MDEKNPARQLWKNTDIQEKVVDLTQVKLYATPHFRQSLTHRHLNRSCLKFTKEVPYIVY